MPNIRPSSDLRNNYSEISRQCKDTREPVFLTVNGKGDTVILSIQEYEKQQVMLEFFSKMAEADADIASGNTFTHEEVFAKLDQRLKELQGK